jgi:hypothetical protein
MLHPHLEVWNSSENRQERHYFLKDGNSHAYQNADYLFGVNPKLVTPVGLGLATVGVRICEPHSPHNSP